MRRDDEEEQGNPFMRADGEFNSPTSPHLQGPGPAPFQKGREISSKKQGVE